MGRVRDSRDLLVYLLRSAGARARGRARRQGVLRAPSLLKEPSTTTASSSGGPPGFVRLEGAGPGRGMRGEGDGRGRTGDSDVNRPLSTQHVRGSAFFQALPGCAGCVLLAGALSWGDLL